MRRVEIEPKFDAWRAAARRLLAAGLPPEQALWVEAGGVEQGILPGLGAPMTETSAPDSGFRISRQFLDLARAAACHGDPDRWALLYRMLWRQAHGEPRLLENEVDDDVRRLALLEKAVRRDSHKMKAFVRFRRLVARIHRTPTLGEAAACRPWLEEEIALVKPEVIVCLGATAARSLLGAEFRLTRRRGEILEGASWAPRVMATWHPSALLRIPEEEAKERARRELVADLSVISKHLEVI